MAKTYTSIFIICTCLLSLQTKMYGQTRMTLGAKPKIESVSPTELPKSSTAYTPAEKQRYQSLVTSAYKALLADSLDKAKDYFTQAIGLLPNHPSNAEAYFQLGQIAESHEQYTEASNLYRKSIRQNENMPKAYERHAAVNIILGSYDTAIRDYSRLLQLKPGYTTAIFHRGYAYQCKGDTARARKEYEKVMAIDPANSQAASALATIKSRQGDNTSALLLMDKQIAIHPNDANLYNTRGVLEMKTHKYELALYDFNKAIEIAPSDINGYLNRAALHDRLDNKALAERDREQAVKLGATAAQIERSKAKTN